LKTKSGQWVQSLQNCPSGMITTCKITVFELLQSPFSYKVGDLLTAKVNAYNGIGVSPSKDSNQEIIKIIVVPDAPVQLTRDSSATTTSAAGLNWQDGASDGGTPVIDYRVSYD